MECSCAVDIYEDDYEPVACLNHGARIARKDHKCRECGRSIKAGEKYNYTSYLFDGKWCVEKDCSDCQSAIDKFFPRGGFADLWLDIAEEINNSEGEIPESCIADLTPMARERLCDMMDEYFSGC